MRSADFSNKDGDLGFQIAPMIDVVFVIMLFFMVMAGSVKIERELNQKLPGSVETAGSIEFNDEVIIDIANTGEIALNDEILNKPEDKNIEALSNALMRLKQLGDSSKTPVLVTVVSEPDAKYARVIDALDALAVAQITNVTFTVSDEEE